MGGQATRRARTTKQAGGDETLAIRDDDGRWEVRGEEKWPCSTVMEGEEARKG